MHLGRTSVEVSSLCLGTANFGSKHDRETCFDLLDFFRANGGSFVDTANMYASWIAGCVGGESESTIGQYIAERSCRHELQIASKVGFPYPGCEGGLTAVEIERECEKSLQRLNTDYLDVYFAHCDDRVTPQEETMAAFEHLIQDGKVRAIGASNLVGWRVTLANQFSELHCWHAFCAIQQRYTYLRPRPGATFGEQVYLSEPMRDYSRTSGVTLLGYSILLGGAYDRAPSAPPAEFDGPDAVARLATLADVARELHATRNQVVIAWMRQSDPPILPIIAASSMAQLAENIGALELHLSAEQMERLNRAGDPV
jgi:aryl-alcohol dehydrogenase-like predicted oxidoreductase